MHPEHDKMPEAAPMPNETQEVGEWWANWGAGSRSSAEVSTSEQLRYLAHAP